MLLNMPLIYNKHGMTKRKINQQQQRRVAEKQYKQLNTPVLSGLVIAHHGLTLEVEGADGSIRSCNKRQHLGPIVPGDRIKWQLDLVAGTGVVTAVEPRVSLLSRPDARGTLHAVAANVDQMCIVIAPTPAPNQTTIDRYLVAAANQNIEALLVLNKEDLLPVAPQQQALLALIKVYKSIGVATIVVSAKHKQNLELLYEQLTNKTSVVVGQSGVGKSSLIETLLPEIGIRTGELSAQTLLGKHTTTNSRLYHLSELHGNIIDSPGMREFPLWKLEAATLAQGFIEFRPYLMDCKYRNCTHLHEPSCGLITAVQADKISAMRLESYQKILTEMIQEQH
jgi:ribosome biogenesis GTPase